MPPTHQITTLGNLSEDARRTELGLGVGRSTPLSTSSPKGATRPASNRLAGPRRRSRRAGWGDRSTGPEAVELITDTDIRIGYKDIQAHRLAPAVGHRRGDVVGGHGLSDLQAYVLPRAGHAFVLAETTSAEGNSRVARLGTRARPWTRIGPRSRLASLRSWYSGGDQQGLRTGDGSLAWPRGCRGTRVPTWGHDVGPACDPVGGGVDGARNLPAPTRAHTR